MWQSFRNGRVPEDVEIWESALDLLAQKVSWDALHLVTPQDLINLASFSARQTRLCLHGQNKRSTPGLACGHTPFVATSAHIPAVSTCQTGSWTRSLWDTKLLMTSPDHASTAFSTAAPTCHLRKLRAAFLLIKLLSVISIFNPVQNHVRKGVTTLLTALGSLAVAIERQAKKSMRDSEVLEAQELSLHIARLAIPVMKQLVKTDNEDCFYCCHMLTHLMSGNKPAVCQAVASWV